LAMLLRRVLRFRMRWCCDRRAPVALTSGLNT
jgi:hypothetical protein